jgi:hypothetical protein
MQVVETTHDIVQAETQSVLNIALVGGGSDCKSLIQFLEAHKLQHFHVHIIGVAGANEHSPGLAYAREKGIYTTSDYRNLFNLENLHLIIELTGRNEVLHEIVRSKPKHIKVMDHVSARLFWELIELQEQKAKYERKLVHSDRLTSVGRMASYLAHEIRNPLVSIGGFADNILEAPDLPESLKPKAQIIVDQVRRLERVLKNMWEYIRPLKQNRTTNLEPFFSFKIGYHGDQNYCHDNPEKQIGIPPFQLRHILEIHSVNAGKKGHGNKYRCDDS